MSASVQDELARMRVILQDLERRLEDGEVPPDGLPEFKSVVDEIRLRVWGLLAAAEGEASKATAERFRLGRAAELCRRSSPPVAWARTTRSGPRCSRLRPT